MIKNINHDIVFSLNGEEPLLKFYTNGDVFYNFNGEMKIVEERSEILDAFKYCILGFYGEEPDKILFDKVLEKIDNGGISEQQFKEIEKRIRKAKLKKLG